MTSAEIRENFLDFFRENAHETIASSSLLPRNDPTLLFTNAGMVQFKGVFLGQEPRPSARAASSQKCMRAGGKHSDIENVGRTARHHTFFEMLGNFSFGDYFKREAIVFAWELLTKRYGLSPEALWATVYEDDDEAEALWVEHTGIAKNRVVRLGAEDNFWQMADTGPCGPCSEIIIDQGPELGCGADGCAVGCDCDRYLELWNLVFMQFDRSEDGVLTPLPKPSIDTGMGLERLTAVLQGKVNNFDTDLFTGIISAIEQKTKATYGANPESDVSIRVIADHIRAASFLLSDGLAPSNDGRGYVLRRIIRRASRHARLLGVQGPVLHSIVGPVAEAMGSHYRELINESKMAAKTIRFEEERFSRTLEQGSTVLEGVIASLKAKGEDTIPGQEIFRLYDTFGFPADLTTDIARDAGLKVDDEGFRLAMEGQRQRARASWVGREEAVQPVYRKVEPAEFVGYGDLQAQASVKAILLDGGFVDEIIAGQEAEVFLDKTPFYGESGGQVGDSGRMSSEGGSATVLDTKKPLDGVFSHMVKVQEGVLRAGDAVTCEVDPEHRAEVRRSHTATHLLHTALRAAVGDHVKQAGSMVSPGRFRFDFTHFSSLSAADLSRVEDIVNEKILENLPVHTEEMGMQEAVSAGAIALFGEKYGDRVRVVKAGDFSTELCGGTHSAATGEIGSVKILSEGSVASGIRRIEALSGKEARQYLKQRDEELQSISLALKSPQDTAGRVNALLEEMKALQREMEKLKGRAAHDASADIVSKAKDVGGIKVVAEKTGSMGQKDLRGLADSIRDRLGAAGVIVLASVNADKAALLAMLTPDLVERLSAAKILSQVAALTGGRAGGRNDLAQGGAPASEALDKALDSVYDIVKETLI